MKNRFVCLFVVLAAVGLCEAGCAVVGGKALATSGAKFEKPWRGVHFFSPGRAGLPLLKRAIAEKLVPMGVNVVVLEVNYGFEYQSHPELVWKGAVSASEESGAIRKEDARDLAEFCRKLGVRLIPQFNCFGHQSWHETLFSLLSKYPDMDEAPGVKTKYCRSWCPLHPKVNEIAFALMDELVDAFQADTIHVGMDEVFLIANEKCPRCNGKIPAELFAKAVNDYYQHLVVKKGLTMLMWGDRLLEADKLPGYTEWDASKNGTWPAIDLIPKDIVICDWHYDLNKNGYPSVKIFVDKGFRVWPTTWKTPEAGKAIYDYSMNLKSDRVIGLLCTTWYGPFIPPAILGEAKIDPEKPDKDAVAAAQAADSVRQCMEYITKK